MIRIRAAIIGYMARHQSGDKPLFEPAMDKFIDIYASLALDGHNFAGSISDLPCMACLVSWYISHKVTKCLNCTGIELSRYVNLSFPDTLWVSLPLLEGHPWMTGGFLYQKPSNTESVSMPWRHEIVSKTPHNLP